jgi:hypothetical protein
VYVFLYLTDCDIVLPYCKPQCAQGIQKDLCPGAGWAARLNTSIRGQEFKEILSGSVGLNPADYDIICLGVYFIVSLNTTTAFKKIHKKQMGR